MVDNSNVPELQKMFDHSNKSLTILINMFDTIGKIPNSDENTKNKYLEQFSKNLNDFIYNLDSCNMNINEVFYHIGSKNFNPPADVKNSNSLFSKNQITQKELFDTAIEGISKINLKI